jgi:hypothetical protein
MVTVKVVCTVRVQRYSMPGQRAKSRREARRGHATRERRATGPGRGTPRRNTRPGSNWMVRKAVLMKSGERKKARMALK